MSRGSQRQPPFVCACVQFNVRRGDVEHNIRSAAEGIRAAVAEGARLLVLPEMWPTSFASDFGDQLIEASRQAEREMIELSRAHQVVIVGGGVVREDGRHFNRALLVDRGAVLGSYRKIHLFSPNAENRHMAAGDTPLIADTSLGRIGVLICYDIRFPELVRYYFYQNIDILVVPSQWPEARSEHWRTLLRARAIENEMFIAGCNRTGTELSLKTEETLSFPGDSRIVDPMGETIGAGTGEEGPVLAEIEPRKVQTMRRILPIRKDRRLDVYRRLWQADFAVDRR